MGVFHRSGPGDASAVEMRLRAAIAGLRPLLGDGTHGIELAEFDVSTAVAVLRLSGGCSDCDMTAEMLIEGIEAHLRRHVPELRGVRTLPSRNVP
jgi:Fe-S cluster biogenesis protein NfuA